MAIRSEGMQGTWIQPFEKARVLAGDRLRMVDVYGISNLGLGGANRYRASLCMGRTRVSGTIGTINGVWVFQANRWGKNAHFLEPA